MLFRSRWPRGRDESGRADPTHTRGIAPKTAHPGSQEGVRSNLGWDKWRWAGIWGKASVSTHMMPGTLVVPGNLTNRFGSLILTRCENAKYLTRAT